MKCQQKQNTLAQRGWFILPDVVAYFESERGQREFAEWKAQQEAEKKEKSEVA